MFGLLLAAIAASALVSAGASVASAKINANSTEETNKQNIEMQEATNAQAQFNMEHAHQIEMADLKAAGLNPVLTAMGGSGAPLATLNSPKAVAPQYDLSGINSAMSSLSSAAMMSMMMQYRLDMATERNATLSAIAKGHDSQSAANAALRASRMGTAGNAALSSAKQFSGAGYSLEEAAKSMGISVSQLKKILSYSFYK